MLEGVRVKEREKSKERRGTPRAEESKGGLRYASLYEEPLAAAVSPRGPYFKTVPNQARQSP